MFSFLVVPFCILVLISFDPECSSLPLFLLSKIVSSDDICLGILLIFFLCFPNFFIVSFSSMIGVAWSGGDFLVRSTHHVHDFFVIDFLLRLGQPNFDQHVSTGVD
jgi:hypothetical protein